MLATRGQPIVDFTDNQKQINQPVVFKIDTAWKETTLLIK